MNAYLALYVREAAADGQSPVADVAERIWANTARELLVCAAHVKHEAFAEEREWRLVSPPIMTQHESVKFRMGRHSLVPYLEFDLVDEHLPSMPLHEIIVGPTPDPRATQHAIMSMQLSVRYSDHARVEPCGIPYREV
jgi:hypothetical protein